MKQIISFKKDIPFNTKIGEVTSISLEHSLKMVEQDHITGEFIISGDYKITDISVNKEPFSYNLPFEIALDTRYNTDNVRVDIDDFYYEIINNQIMNVNIDVFIDGIEVIEEFNTDNDEKEDIEMNERTLNAEEVSNINTSFDNNVVEDDVLDDGSEMDNVEDDVLDDRSEIDNMEEDDVLNNSFETDGELEINDRMEEDDIMNEEDRKIMNLFKEIETPPVDITIEDNSSENIKSLFDTFDDKSETFTTYHVHIVRESDTIDTIVAKYRTTKEEVALYNRIDELKLGDKIVIPAITNE